MSAHRSKTSSSALTDPVKIAMASLRLAAKHGPGPPQEKDFQVASGWLAAGLARFPGHPSLVRVQAILETARVPAWHFPMLRDDRRNRAFEAAIQRCIRPGQRVLEIGAGSGLLAMMAARAGADHVFTCEGNPKIAEAARMVIAANGLGDRITVQATMSTDLTSQDIGGKADVLIAEVFGDSLAEEGAVVSIGHARAHLLKETAVVIPARARLFAALADYLPGSAADLTDVCGFDLSRFSRLNPLRRKIESNSRDLILRGPPAQLIDLDFAMNAAPATQEVHATLVSSGGLSRYVATWLSFDLTAGVDYSNAPSAEYRSHWAVNLHSLADQRFFEPREPLDIGAAYDVAGVHIWFK